MAERIRLIGDAEQQHLCLECGAVWSGPTQCPFNGADAETVPVQEVGELYLQADHDLRTENKKLREALERITRLEHDSETGRVDDQCACSIARSALADPISP